MPGPSPSRTAIAVAAPWPPGASTRAVAEQHDADRRQQDDQVEPDRAVLHVIQVVGQLLAGILDRGAIGVIDLRPSGEAGFHVGALAVERNRPDQLLDEVRTFRPRSDQAHVAADDIAQLRQFIDAGGAEESSDPDDAGILLLRPARLAA